MERPVAILGLDGATWDVIDPLLAQGKLPTLAGLIENGAYGRIATLPGYTSPALWTTILTGKLPEKHGVRDFYTATGRHLRAKPVYEILDQEPIGLFQMYAVRRKEHMKGFVVPSRIEGKEGACPPELAFILDFGSVSGFGESLALARELLLHGVPPWVIAQVAWLAFVNKTGYLNPQEWKYKTSLLGQRLRGYVAASLVRRARPHFFASLFYTLDHLGHYYWRYWEPSRWSGFNQKQVTRYGKAISDAYIEVDKNLARILHALPESTLVVVVSDHGMEAATGDSGGEPLTIRGLEILKLLGFSDRFVTELLPPFRSIFRASYPNWTTDDSRQLVHQLSEATLLSSGSRPFLVDSTDGQSVIARVKPGVIDDLQEIVIFPSGQEVKLSEFLFQHRMINGAHSNNGILIMSGSGVRPGALLEGSSLTDVTPTVLALSGFPIARDMDGGVIAEAIEDSFIKRFSLKEIDTYEDGDEKTGSRHLDREEQLEIEARLKELGYLA